MHKTFFQRWRFLNQVTFVLIILQLIIFIIIYQLTINHFIYLSALMKKTQIELLRFINVSQNNIISEIYANSCNYGILRSQLKLMAADRLNHFIQLYKINIPDPQLCLTPPFICDKYAINDTYSYAFMNASINQIPQNALDHQAMKLSAMLTYTHIFSDDDIYLYFTTSSNSLYFSVKPGTSYTNFNPHQRTWSLNNSQAMIDHPNNTYFSDPYMSIIYQSYFIAQTKALTSLQYLSQGILSTGINFRLFKLYQINNQTIQIIDRYGKLLLQQNDTLNPYYIYNTNITGYSYDDFQSLKQFERNSSNFTCVIEDIELTSTLCLNNQLTNQKLIVNSKSLPESQFIVLITQDLSQTAQYIILNLQSFNENIEWIQSSYLKMTFSIAILLITLSCMVLQLVLRKIHQIKNFIKYYLRGGLTSKLRRNVEVLRKSRQIHKSSDLLEKLTYRILVIHDKTHKLGKCEECLQLENQKYYLEISYNDDCIKNLSTIHKLIPQFDELYGIISMNEIISMIRHKI